MKQFSLFSTAFAASNVESVEETHAETGSAEAHSPQGLSINPAIVGFQALNFVILLVILHFLILKPLLKMLNERSRKIQEGVENAEKAQQSLEETNIIRKDILKDAQAKNQEILEKGRKAGDELKATILQEAHQEAASIIEKAQHLAEMEKAKAMKEFQAMSAQIILKATEKFLREKMDPAKDTKLIQETLTHYFS